jgi:hypothetical protein
MKLVIREVLAAAYIGQAHHGRMHSHGAEVDDRGEVVRVLCGNVKPGSMADAGATDPGAKVPTCGTVLETVAEKK